MCARSPKGKSGRTNYTQITDAQIRGLVDAKASGNEVLAYIFLSRFHGDPNHPDECFASAQVAEAKTGLKAAAYTRALNSLRDKYFTVTDGGEIVSVLSKEEEGKGHRGRIATFTDNLYRLAVLEGTYPRANANPKKEVPNRTANQSRKAVPNRTANGVDSSADSTCYEAGDSNAISYELQHETVVPEEISICQRGEGVMSNARGNQPLCNESTSSSVDVVTDETVPLEAYGSMPEYRGRYEPEPTPFFDAPIYDTPVSVYEREVLADLFDGCATAPSSFPTDVWGE